MVVGRYAKLGEACILNDGALIDHHVIILECCHILMEAVVRDMVTVKALTRVESLTAIQ